MKVVYLFAESLQNIFTTYAECIFVNSLENL